MENVFFRFYGVSFTSLRSVWDMGVDAPSKQVDILESLNSNEGHFFSMYCTAKLVFDAIRRDSIVDVHIDSVEAI